MQILAAMIPVFESIVGEYNERKLQGRIAIFQHTDMNILGAEGYPLSLSIIVSRLINDSWHDVGFIAAYDSHISVRIYKLASILDPFSIQVRLSPRKMTLDWHDPCVIDYLRKLVLTL